MPSAFAQENGTGITTLEMWQIAIIAIFLGNFLRSVFPYVQKLREAQSTTPTATTLKWDHRYTLTLLTTLFTSFVGTILFFATWSPPAGTQLQVFVASFLTGWGSQDAINRLVT